MPVVTIALMFQVTQLKSQSDSIKPAALPDSSSSQILAEKRLHKWMPIQAIVPAALITYGVIALHTDALQDINENFQNGIWVQHPHDKYHLDNYLQWTPGVALYGLKLAGVKSHDKLRDMSVIYGMSLVINSVSTQIVKGTSHEWRPDGSDNKSFPSGHTSNAFVAAELMRLEYKSQSPWYGIAGYAVAATTGFYRMYNNKHWFGDVMAGAGFGILSTDISWWIYPSIKRWLFKNEQKSTTMIMPFYDPNMGAGFGLVHHF